MSEASWSSQAGSDLWGGRDDGALVPSPKWSPFGDSSHEYVWQDDALCDGLEDVFEMAEHGEPSVEGLSHAGVIQHNLSNYEYAKSICESCPVRESCLSSADPADLFWTVRGGLMPTLLSKKLESVKPYVPSFQYDDYNLWSCKKHDRKDVGVRMYRKQNGEPYQAPFCKICSMANKDPNRPR